ncbi:cytoplasmic protein [Clostridium sp. SHJSY1]|uniref:cytoplasmic protein n=1 Tax=Clostridium sp. SHJSY1 TaxID=2942483 RepID=UPI0028768E5E|nr:cytoplasmic protein [Clostridium sp. SHJSY1]MDS0525516.1 cytoplasmic protein [Clostridium sp. SHJSY1]
MLVKTKVEKIQTLNSSEILFSVKNGLAKLNSDFIKNENEEIKLTYFLEDTPLIMINSEYCPTCFSMIQLAEGRESVDNKIISILNNINEIENLEDGFHKIKSILSLLHDGYYILKETELIPTDGEENYFWNLNSKSKNYNASADYYYPNYGVIYGQPKFMVPSQGTNCYNNERVEYYREKIKNGEKLYGIAIELGGFLALLIDGHHKATASYLEGKTLSCITIIRPYKYNNYNIGEEGINYLGKYIPFNKLNNSKDIKDYYNKDNNTSSADKYKKLILEEKQTIQINIGNSRVNFPCYDDIALSYLAEDTSEEKVTELLNYIGEYPLEELKYVFYNFKVNNKAKARELCFKILSLICFQEIWDICIEFLSSYRDEEVEEIFINIIVEYDQYNCSNYGNIKNIIDSYFKL